MQVQDGRAPLGDFERIEADFPTQYLTLSGLPLIRYFSPHNASYMVLMLHGTPRFICTYPKMFVTFPPGSSFDATIHAEVLILICTLSLPHPPSSPLVLVLIFLDT